MQRYVPAHLTTPIHHPWRAFAVVQWSKGEYAGASNTQDDLSIISRHLPRREPLHGASPASATPLASGDSGGGGGARAVASVFGVIQEAGGASWFEFESGAPGAVGIQIGLVPDVQIQDVDPLFVRANLDSKLSVYGPVNFPAPGGAAGADASPLGAAADEGSTAAAALPLVAAFDPQGALLVGPLSVNLPAAGRYLVSLAGAGDGPDASTGYTRCGRRFTKPFMGAADGVRTTPLGVRTAVCA